MEPGKGEGPSRWERETNNWTRHAGNENIGPQRIVQGRLHFAHGPRLLQHPAQIQTISTTLQARLHNFKSHQPHHADRVLWVWQRLLQATWLPQGPFLLH
jgi:hypothetical protein